MTTARRYAAALLLGALTLSGCSGGGGDGDGAPPDSSSTGSAAAVPKPPKVGACYALSVSAALEDTSSKPPVPCSRKHTAVTVAVGTVRPVVDGHLLAFGSAKVQRQIADRCVRSVDAHIGGGVAKQRLSRVQAVWFSPTPDQVDRGALWYRCDLVVSSGKRTFASLPRKTRGMLAASGAMNRWGTCGTAAPSSKAFGRVLCSARHSWRARATISLPRGTAYLSTSAGKVADARCRDVAAKLSPKSLKLRWAFEWPTRAQWRSGQRFGFCWTPD